MWLKLLVCQVLLFAKGDAFGNGAPGKSCNDLYAKHHVVQMATPSPYVLETDVTSYSPGQRVKVTVRSPVNVTFRGIIMAARRTYGDTEGVVGTLEMVPKDLKPLSWYADPPGSINCVTHKDISDKTSVTVEWIAPSSSVGDVIFRASLVKTFDTFWYDIVSVVLTANEPAQDNAEDYKISDQLSPITLEDCGTSKGCFLYPDGCGSVAECKYGLTHKPSEDRERVQFEVFGEAKGYISMSTSSDIKMGDEWTVSCMEKEGRRNVQNGHNPALHNDPHRRVNLRDIQLTRENGKILCRFTKLVKEIYIVADEKYRPVPKEYDLSGYQYLFLAWGDLYPETTIMKKHTELPLVSTSRVNLFENTLTRGRTLHIYLQTHGAMALIAWMTLGGVAVIVSKHFRVVLRNAILGTATWLQVHRAAMYISTGTCAVAIILIFVYLKAWTLYATAHAITGLVAMGLALMVALSGLLRPETKSRKWTFFTWLHRIGGTSAFYLAAASMYLGFQVELIEHGLQVNQKYIILIWLGFHVLCDLILDKLPFKGISYGSSSNGTTKVNLDANDTEVQENKPQKSLHPKLIMLAIYIIVNLIFLITSLYYLLSS